MTFAKMVEDELARYPTIVTENVWEMPKPTLLTRFRFAVRDLFLRAADAI